MAHNYVQGERSNINNKGFLKGLGLVVAASGLGSYLACANPEKVDVNPNTHVQRQLVDSYSKYAKVAFDSKSDKMLKQFRNDVYNRNRVKSIEDERNPITAVLFDLPKDRLTGKDADVTRYTNAVNAAILNPNLYDVDAFNYHSGIEDAVEAALYRTSERVSKIESMEVATSNLTLSGPKNIATSDQTLEWVLEDQSKPKLSYTETDGMKFALLFSGENLVYADLTDDLRKTLEDVTNALSLKSPKAKVNVEKTVDNRVNYFVSEVASLFEANNKMINFFNNTNEWQMNRDITGTDVIPGGKAEIYYLELNEPNEVFSNKLLREIVGFTNDSRNGENRFDLIRRELKSVEPVLLDQYGLPDFQSLLKGNTRGLFIGTNNSFDRAEVDRYHYFDLKTDLVESDLMVVSIDEMVERVNRSLFTELEIPTSRFAPESKENGIRRKVD